MTNSIQVEILSPDEWARWRNIRLRALQVNPEAFGGNFLIESEKPESEWRSGFEKFDVLIAKMAEVDIAVMTIEVLSGDHGATCWIGGCWSDPDFRGKGSFRALFDYVDSHVGKKDWSRQGLGVWADNENAVAAYKKLGFEFAGDLMPSDRQPGRFYTHMIRES